MRTKLASLVLIWVCGLLTTTGCGVSVGWMMTNPAPRALKPRPAEEVQLFTATVPTRSFVEHGLVTAGVGQLGPGEFAQLGALREEAAKHGCDGLVVTSENKLAVGDGYGSAAERTSGFRAVCIVYND
jgi:hypothetical protein